MPTMARSARLADPASSLCRSGGDLPSSIIGRATVERQQAASRHSSRGQGRPTSTAENHAEGLGRGEGSQYRPTTRQSAWNSDSTTARSPHGSGWKAAEEGGRQRPGVGTLAREAARRRAARRGGSPVFAYRTWDYTPDGSVGPAGRLPLVSCQLSGMRTSLGRLPAPRRKCGESAPAKMMVGTCFSFRQGR